MKLDLNFLSFQKELLALSKADLNIFIKSAKKISKMDIITIKQSSGLNLEKIKNIKTLSGKTLYSIRMSKSFRAVITIDGDYFRFISLHPDHDSAYKN